MNKYFFVLVLAFSFLVPSISSADLIFEDEDGNVIPTQRLSPEEVEIILDILFPDDLIWI